MGESTDNIISKLEYCPGKEDEYLHEFCRIKFGDENKKGVSWRFVQGRFSIFKGTRLLIQFSLVA